MYDYYNAWVHGPARWEAVDENNQKQNQLNGLEWGIEAGDNGGMGRDSSAVASYY